MGKTKFGEIDFTDIFFIITRDIRGFLFLKNQPNIKYFMILLYSLSQKILKSGYTFGTPI